jgi:predicted oxidoreductase
VERSQELERQAVALVSKYGLFMPGPVKAFLAEVADFLMWDNLKEKLK